MKNIVLSVEEIKYLWSKSTGCPRTDNLSDTEIMELDGKLLEAMRE